MNLVPLSFEQHGDLKLKAMKPSDEVLTAVSPLPVFLSELSELADEYAIVFTKATHPQPVVVMRSSDIQPLPKMMQLYPFFGLVTSAEKVDILVDADAPNIQQSTGKKIFKKDGTFSKMLEETVESIAQLAGEALQMQSLTAELAFRQVFQPIENSQFLMVDMERYKQLDDTVLAHWAESGVSHLVETHLASLKNL